MNDLRLPANCYLAALALAALAAAASALSRGGMPGREDAVLALTLGGLAALAGLFPLSLSFKTKLYLDTSVLIAALLVLGPGPAILLAGAGTALAHALRRQPWDQALFNTAQAMLVAAAGAATLAVGGWRVDAPGFGQPGQVLLVVAAGGAMVVVNDLLVATMIGLQAGMPTLRVWWQALRHADRVEYLAQLAQVGLGALAAVVVAAHPWMLALLLLPAVAVHRALAHAIELRRRAEAALRDRDAMLAEAQRVAQLGSWDWDLASGEQIWSDEVYRILGLVPGGIAPTYEAFLRHVHPADRAAFDRAVHEALYAGQAFGHDHRVRRPDGTERIVHERGEVVRDEAGEKVRLVGTIHDVTERKALEARLAHQAFHDALTGLPNRARFLDRLDQALAPARRRAGGVAILFVDLDGFKAVNDGLGHEAGDQLLVGVAGRLRACVRVGDTLARLGGDEFTFLLEGVADEREARRVVERIAEELRAPFDLAGHRVFVTPSVGIAVAAAGDGAADLLRQADVAMYEAKRRGKARFEIFEAGMDERVLARLQGEAELRRAIDHGELAVHYQPLVELATGRIAKVEALVRWQHPTRGLLPPAEFIPLAEETGLVVPLGRWVLEAACRQACAWQAEHPSQPPLLVSVNLSARQVRDPGLVEDVARVLGETGLDPGRLELEITESAAMEDEAVHVATLRALKGLGVRLAVDDFGTGYSALSYLRRCPVDTLKIDRAYVAGLEHNPEDEAIVRAVLAFAKTLDLGVTAEGIETAGQLARLQGLGCDQGQGYYFARPLPPEATGLLLAGAHRWPGAGDDEEAVLELAAVADERAPAPANPPARGQRDRAIRGPLGSARPGRRPGHRSRRPRRPVAPGWLRA